MVETTFASPRAVPIPNTATFSTSRTAGLLYGISSWNTSQIYQNDSGKIKEIKWKFKGLSSNELIQPTRLFYNKLIFES